MRYLCHDKHETIPMTRHPQNVYAHPTLMFSKNKAQLLRMAMEYRVTPRAMPGRFLRVSRAGMLRVTQMVRLERTA